MLCLLKKIVSFAEDEIAAYAEVREKSFAPIGRFANKIGRPIFELALIYPLNNDPLAARLLSALDDVGSILGDGARTQGHFYFGAADFHLTLLCHTSRSHLLSEAHKQWHRDAALDLFSNENRKEIFVKPKIHFFGGGATQDSVIVHGYNFAELNRSRVALARYGLREVLERRNGRFELVRPRLFDDKRSDELATQIFFEDRVYPNIAHLTLLRFGRPVAQKEQIEINELLGGIDFGEAVFPELGLYEFSSYGVFSNSQRRAQLIFTGP
jgi:hypothetical protein